MARKRNESRFVTGTGFAVFIIFFGLSLYEALLNKDLLGAIFWIAIGIVFLAADNIVKRK